MHQGKKTTCKSYKNTFHTCYPSFVEAREGQMKCSSQDICVWIEVSFKARNHIDWLKKHSRTAAEVREHLKVLMRVTS